MGTRIVAVLGAFALLGLCLLTLASLAQADSGGGVVRGSFSIAGVSQTATPTSTATHTPTATPTPTPEVTETPPTGSLPCLCDVNDDGILDASESDVNRDGVVDVRDIMGVAAAPGCIPYVPQAAAFWHNTPASPSHIPLDDVLQLPHRRRDSLPLKPGPM